MLTATKITSAIIATIAVVAMLRGASFEKTEKPLAQQLQEKGDMYPFCLEPTKYPTSMRSATEPINLARYMGRWYEIASLGASAQAPCVCSNANYQLSSTMGFAKVRNECILPNGQVFEIEGKATPVNRRNTELTVDFG